MFNIRLTFCSGNSIELFRVDCSNGIGGTTTCIRGKTPGAFRGAGTFQWSSAVRAVACLFIRAKLMDEDPKTEAMLSGGAKSLAASLDYALTKQPGWILDMFGVSSGGKTLARRLFSVTNSHRKRGGPVSISLNTFLCPLHAVEVVLDGKGIEDPDTLRRMIQAIEGYELPDRAGKTQNEPIARDADACAPIDVWGSPADEVAA